MSVCRTQQRSGGQPDAEHALEDPSSSWKGPGQNRIGARARVTQNIHADGRRRTAPERRNRVALFGTLGGVCGAGLSELPSIAVFAGTNVNDRRAAWLNQFR
jgi:hypothetical protein